MCFPLGNRGLLLDQSDRGHSLWLGHGLFEVWALCCLELGPAQWNTSGEIGMLELSGLLQLSRLDRESSQWQIGPGAEVERRLRILINLIPSVSNDYQMVCLIKYALIVLVEVQLKRSVF